MGVHIYLDIIPQRIDARVWAELYAETLVLLRSHPTVLMGLGTRSVAGIRLAMYTREIEHHPDQPARRYWCVSGDFTSRRTGETFTMYRDLQHYAPAGKVKFEDILLHDPGEEGEATGVFSAKTQGEPYHIAILAAAMMVESRLPQQAIVSGEIDREQARAAQAWAQEVLKCKLALPVRVDIPALYQRLSAQLSGRELLNRFDDLLLAAPDEKMAACCRYFERELLDRWLSERLAALPSVHSLGAIELFIRWLNVTGDLESLCRLACLHEQGPRSDPLEFAQALAATWIMVKPEARAFLDCLDRPAGTIDTPITLIGSVFLDLEAAGRHIRRHLELDEIERIFTGVFPGYAVAMMDAMREQTEQIQARLDKLREPLVKRFQDLEQRGNGAPDTWVHYKDLDELSADRQIEIKSIAYLVRSSLRSLQDACQALPVPDRDRDNKFLTFLAAFHAERGPILTEDAWEWIASQRDEYTLQCLLALATLPIDQAQLSRICEAALENRQLGQAIVQLSRDDALMEETARFLNKRR